MLGPGSAVAGGDDWSRLAGHTLGLEAGVDAAREGLIQWNGAAWNSGQRATKKCGRASSPRRALTLPSAFCIPNMQPAFPWYRSEKDGFRHRLRFPSGKICLQISSTFAVSFRDGFRHSGVSKVGTMPRRNRVGAAVRWITLCVSFFTVSAWVFSSQRIVGYGYGTSWCAIGYGRFTLYFPGIREAGESFCYSRSTNELDSWADQFGLVTPSAGGCGIELPLWILAVVFGAATWKLLPRRIEAGHCVGCGYDLTGNTSGRCSECGRAAGESAQSGPRFR